MAQSIQEVGGHARSAAGLTERVSERAEEGSRAVGATIEGIEFRAMVADPEVATPAGVTFDPGWAPGELYVSVDFTGPGETILTIEAVHQQDGTVAARIDIPVTVTEVS